MAKNKVARFFSGHAVVTFKHAHVFQLYTTTVITGLTKTK